MKRKPERHSVLAWSAILGLVFLQALVWWWLTPAWAAPDEPSHFLYTRLLAPAVNAPLADTALEAELLRSLADEHWWAYNHLSPPTAPLPRLNADSTLAASGSQIGQEPPLFYRLAAGWWRLRPHKGADTLAAQLRWLRLASVVLRLLTVLVALTMLQMGSQATRQRLWGGGMLVGLLPMVGFVGGSHNNDVLAMFWGSLSFAWLVRARHGWAYAVAWLLAIMGPLWVDRSLIFLWPLTVLWTLIAWSPSRRVFRLVIGVCLLLLLVLVTPNQRWASGWRRSPALMRSRQTGALLLPASPDASPRLAQTLSDKRVAALRGQTLRLRGERGKDAGALSLTLTDNDHSAGLVCPATAGIACTLAFRVAAHATFVHITATSPDPPVYFRLSLRDEADHEVLFNSDGALPAPWGNPLFVWLERSLPVPAEFFDRALAPDAWDAASQFRYLLFAGFTWASFWGWFGWLSRPYPLWMYAVLALATMAAAWGVLQRLMLVVHRAREKRLEDDDRLFGAALLAVACLLAQIALPMAGQAWQPQGRYLFPGILPLAILLYAGWEAVWPQRWRRGLVPTLGVLLLLANIVAWGIVAG
ncbi:MAG: hypothetical protein GXP37_00180 [Chloroflexi bacterium]|nr:hypothetical protein [Chloroflexota bacterium]